MKRLLTAAVFSIVALGLHVSQASAGLFLHKCCKKNWFCVKPYNAFSPVCCGTVTLDGSAQAGHDCDGVCGTLNYQGIPVDACCAAGLTPGTDGMADITLPAEGSFKQAPATATAQPFIPAQNG